MRFRLMNAVPLTMSVASVTVTLRCYSLNKTILYLMSLLQTLWLRLKIYYFVWSEE